MKHLITFVIVFLITATNGSYTFAQNSENKTFTKVDEMPVFPGGSEKLSEFIFMNLNYPESARNENLSGEVLVQFIIDMEGNPRDIKVVKGIHPDLDKEAIRVISKMPKWTPGKKDGKYINTMISLPIKFSR